MEKSRIGEAETKDTKMEDKEYFDQSWGAPWDPEALIPEAIKNFFLYEIFKYKNINLCNCSTGMAGEFGYIRCAEGGYHRMLKAFINCWMKRGDPVDETYEWFDAKHTDPAEITLDKFYAQVKVNHCTAKRHKQDAKATEKEKLPAVPMPETSRNATSSKEMEQPAEGKAARKSMRDSACSSESWNDIMMKEEGETDSDESSGEEIDDDSTTVKQEEKKPAGIDMPDAIAIPAGRENRKRPSSIPEAVYSPATTGSPSGTSEMVQRNVMSGWYHRTQPKEVMDLFTEPNTKFSWYKNNENVDQPWERSRRVTLDRGIRLPGVETRGPRTAVHIDPFLGMNFIAETALPVKMRRYQKDLPAEIYYDPYQAERVIIQLPHGFREFRTCTKYIRLNLRIQGANYSTVVFVAEDETSPDLYLGMPFCFRNVKDYDFHRRAIFLTIEEATGNEIMPVTIRQYTGAIERNFTVRRINVRKKLQEAGYTEEQINEMFAIPGNSFKSAE